MINVVLIVTGILVGVFLIPPYAPPNSLTSAAGVPRSELYLVGMERLAEHTNRNNRGDNEQSLGIPR